MAFGAVDDLTGVDFTLPQDHLRTNFNLKSASLGKEFETYIGLAKWNKADLRGFYTPDAKDELRYYSTQFNSIELNATFYQDYSKEQYKAWKEKVGVDFKFFPRLNQTITHLRRMNNVGEATAKFLGNASSLGGNLGKVFHPAA
jgi:uncharacterized protein YecE (DUF72 family)